MMDLRVAVFDVDGTLYDYHDQKIHDSTIEAVQKLKKLGILTVIASARSYPELSDACHIQVSPDYYVGASGHSIVDDKGLAIYNERFSIAQTERIIQFAIKFDLGLTLKYDHVNCLYRYPDEMRKVFENIGTNSSPTIICESMDYHQQELPIGFTIMGACDARIRMENALAYYPHDFRMELFKNGRVADIFLPDVSKVTALKYLLKRLHIGAESCAAFGDGLNDMEMIRWAGIGVAMGNARDELKATADYICENAWEHGISNTINKLTTDSHQLL